MKDHGCLTLDLVLNGNGWGCVFGGCCLGKGYVGADDDYFKGSAKGEEAIMRIMDTVGVGDLLEMEGRFIRVATKGWGSTLKIIGNIVKDKWFDYESCFKDDTKEVITKEVIEEQ